jgi:hypothetical protein
MTPMAIRAATHMGHEENLLSRPFRGSPKLRDMADLSLDETEKMPRMRGLFLSRAPVDAGGPLLQLCPPSGRLQPRPRLTSATHAPQNGRG